MRNPNFSGWNHTFLIVNVNPGLINLQAVQLGGYHLSIRLGLLEEYPPN
jgi:hypothetical protein